MKRGWFGPKLIGWGVSPASWQGWAATGVLILAMAITANLLRETNWVWLPMVAEFVVYLVVVVRTYDKNARTHV